MRLSDVPLEFDFDQIDFHPEYTILLLRDDSNLVPGDVDLSDYVKITSDNIIDGPRIELETNMPAFWEATIPWNPELEKWILQNSLIFYDGKLILRGRFVTINSNDMNSTTTLTGVSELDELKRGSTDIEFNNVRYSDAIKEYVSEETPYDIEIFTQAPRRMQSDVDFLTRNTQSEFEQDIEANETYPIEIVSGRPQAAQSCFVWKSSDASDFKSTDPGDITNSLDYTDGEAVVLHETGDEDDNDQADFIEFTFEPNYTIPAEYVQIYVRHRTNPSQGIPMIEWTLVEVDGDSERSHLIDRHYRRFRRHFSLRWNDISAGWFSPFQTDFEPIDLVAGTTYKLKCEVTDRPPAWDAAYAVDTACVFDSRTIDTSKFDTEWDEVHENNGDLNGPPLGGHTWFELNPFQSTFRIEDVNASIVMSNYENVKMEFSIDRGTTWQPESNTVEEGESITTTFNNPVGTEIRGRIKFGWYTPDDEPQNDTPRFGYEPQRIEQITATGNTDDLPVIDNMELTEGHYSNMLTMLDESGFMATEIPDPDKRQIYVIEPGAVVREIPEEVRVLNHSREIDATGYANRVRAENENGLSFTYFAPDQVERRGEHTWVEYVEGVDDVRTLRAIARSELARRVQKDEVSGELEVVPTVVIPGISYDTGYFDDERLLYRVTFDDTEQPSATLQLKNPEELADIFKQLQRQLS